MSLFLLHKVVSLLTCSCWTAINKLIYINAALSRDHGSSALAAVGGSAAVPAHGAEGTWHVRRQVETRGRGDLTLLRLSPASSSLQYLGQGGADSKGLWEREGKERKSKRSTNTQKVKQLLLYIGPDTIYKLSGVRATAFDTVIPTHVNTRFLQQ